MAAMAQVDPDTLVQGDRVTILSSLQPALNKFIYRVDKKAKPYKRVGSEKSVRHVKLTAVQHIESGAKVSRADINLLDIPCYYYSDETLFIREVTHVRIIPHSVIPFG
jgi:hypothetical protein